MKKIIALLGGFTGAITVTALHQALKYTVPDLAPRMDLLGMEAMKKVRQRIHLPIPSEEELYEQTFVGDIIANTLYYSLAGGNAADLKGTILGIVAGIGAVQLPAKLHLTPAHSSRTKATEYLAMAIYIAGGLAAAATIGSLTQLTHTVEHKVKKAKMPKFKTPNLKRKLHL
jgi:hypothetical protein